MEINYVNAAPQHRALGIEDRSRVPLPEVALNLPTHLPKMYIWAETGSLKPQLLVGGSLVAAYGDKTFQAREPYFNHATALLEVINGQGNMCMVQRLVPDDIGPESSLRIYLDVLETKGPEYEYEIDGSVKLDAIGEPVTTGNEIDIIKLAVVVKDFEGGALGDGTVQSNAGYQTDELTGTQSTLYPIQDLVVPFLGASGNNNGIRIWAPTTRELNGLDVDAMNITKSYPLRFQMIQRDNKDSAGRVYNTVSGSTSVNACYRPEAFDTRFDMDVDVRTALLPHYRSLNVPGFLDRHGLFEHTHVYTDNLEYVLGLMWDLESSYVDGNSDIEGVDKDEELYLLNFIGGYNSNGAPYKAVRVTNDFPEARAMSRHSVLYASGGSDGTINDTVFSQLLGEQLARYGDVYDVETMNTAHSVESIFYDSGVDLQTKYEFFKVISVRKDTAAIVSLHDVNGPSLTAEQESALALSLKTQAQLYVESDTFGTGVVRAAIVGRSGFYSGSKYKRRVPATFELARMLSAFMGASNGRWNLADRFDYGEGKVLKNMHSINVEFTPVPVRHKDWANGMIWVESYDHNGRCHFPATQTVYEHDNSVLNNVINMLICVDLQKIGDANTRYFTGANLSRLELKQQTEARFMEKVKDKYAGLAIIEVETIFTEGDIARGYSWYTRASMYGAIAKTAAAFSISGFRIEDHPSYGAGA